MSLDEEMDVVNSCYDLVNSKFQIYKLIEAPTEKMVQVLERTVKDAKEKISKVDCCFPLNFF